MNSSDLQNPSTYYSIDKFNECFKSNSFCGTNVLRLNISSLPYNCEKLHTLLADIDINFDIIGITEARLRTGQKTLNNIDIEKYVIDHTTTDASCGGTLLYIKEGITYKVQNKLKITRSKELESIFIEIEDNHKRKNIIVGCTYRHPCMDPAKFNDLYLRNLLDILAFENRDIFLMGDFNVNILQYDNNKDSLEFLDKTYSNFLLPYISSTSRVTPRSQTLVDNIFSNKIEIESFSGNITTTIQTIMSNFCY